MLDGQRTIVAHGIANMSRSFLHGAPVPPTNVVVNIDLVEDQYKFCILPFPGPEGNTLSSALLGYTQWPRSLVNPHTTTIPDVASATHQGTDPIGMRLKVVLNLLMAP